MSMGFAKVPVGDWDKVKSGSREDSVPDGDYFARFVRCVNFPPEKSKKGIGTYNLEFVLTEENANGGQLAGKRVVCRCSYHPDPERVTDKDYATMNSISVTNMAQLIDAAGATPELDQQGNFDVALTVEKLAKVEPTVLLAVGHRSEGAKTYQEVGNFRAISR